MATDKSAKSFEETRQFWESVSKAPTDSEGLRPTARDPYLQRSIENIIEQWLSPTIRLLDVGCGDGESTLRFAGGVQSALGVDYIPAFVEQAKATMADRNIENASFELADIMDLSAIRERHGLFDLVVCIRCLINLANWSNQSKALGELAACVKPSGLLLISEGWDDGMEGLNVLRARANLTPIKVVDYNVMLRRAEFESELRRYFEILDYKSLGLYLFMSRVVQPLLVAPNSPAHDHPLNLIASNLQDLCVGEPAFNECDYAGVYVLKRKP